MAASSRGTRREKLCAGWQIGVNFYVAEDQKLSAVSPNSSVPNPLPVPPAARTQVPWSFYGVKFPELDLLNGVIIASRDAPALLNPLRVRFWHEAVLRLRGSYLLVVDMCGVVEEYQRNGTKNYFASSKNVLIFLAGRGKATPALPWLRPKNNFAIRRWL